MRRLPAGATRGAEALHAATKYYHIGQFYKLRGKPAQRPTWLPTYSRSDASTLAYVLIVAACTRSKLTRSCEMLLDTYAINKHILQFVPKLGKIGSLSGLRDSIMLFYCNCSAAASRQAPDRELASHVANDAHIERDTTACCGFEEILVGTLRACEQRLGGWGARRASPPPHGTAVRIHPHVVFRDSWVFA